MAPSPIDDAFSASPLPGEAVAVVTPVTAGQNRVVSAKGATNCRRRMISQNAISGRDISKLLHQVFTPRRPPIRFSVKRRLLDIFQAFAVIAQLRLGPPGYALGWINTFWVGAAT